MDDRLECSSTNEAWVVLKESNSLLSRVVSSWEVISSVWRVEVVDSNSSFFDVRVWICSSRRSSSS